MIHLGQVYSYFFSWIKFRNNLNKKTFMLAYKMINYLVNTNLFVTYVYTKIYNRRMFYVEIINWIFFTEIWFDYRKVPVLVPDNVLWYHAAECHVWNLFPGVHGRCDRLGSGPAARKGIRSCRPVSDGDHGGTCSYSSRIPVLLVNRAVPTWYGLR